MGSRRKRSKTPWPSSERPPEPIFFVDRDLGRRFPEMLRANGLRVEIHDDHYPGEEKPPDHVWLQMAAERRWIAVSHDANIRHTSRSRDTIVEFRVRLIIVKGRARTQELAENFLRTYAAIRRAITHSQGPWIAKLYQHPHDQRQPGRIEMWYEPEPPG
jgi:PIN like domain